jgi:haloalkane dehalogenase
MPIYTLPNYADKTAMKILRTPDHRFDSLADYPFEPHYTVIKTHDGSDLRIHHID